MKLLSSLSRVVPREYLAPSAIAELIKLLKKETLKQFEVAQLCVVRC